VVDNDNHYQLSRLNFQGFEITYKVLNLCVKN